MLHKQILFIVLFVVFTTFFADSNAFSEASRKKVLVVHSYHMEYEWVSIVSRGIKRVFERKDDVHLETVYMDTKRNNSAEWKEMAGKKVKEVISLWKPDVVITVDDNAQEYVGRDYIGQDDISIVFCGVNKAADDYGYLNAPNVCGVLERPHFTETVEFFRAINPNVKTIAVITDNSVTSEGALKYIKKESDAIEGIKFIGFEMPKTFARWKELVSQYEQNADAIVVYTYHTLLDDNSENTVPSRRVMRWMRRNTSIPVLGLLSFSVDDGAMMGVLESAIEHGKEAALMADAILRGKRADDFRVRVADEGTVVLDSVQLGEQGLTLDKKLKDKIDIILGE